MARRLYQRTVQFLTDYFVDELNISPKKRDRLRFGMEILLSGLITIILTLIVAYLLGIIKPVLSVLLAGALLKMLAGGIHMKGPWECAIFTAVITNTLGLVTVNYYRVIYYHRWQFMIISSIYILISLLLWSPADVPEKPIKEKIKIRFFKITSLLFSTIILIIAGLTYHFYGIVYGKMCTGLIFGLLFQVFAISPLAYQLLKLYYQIKKHFNKGGVFR